MSALKTVLDAAEQWAGTLLGADDQLGENPQEEADTHDQIMEAVATVRLAAQYPVGANETLALDRPPCRGCESTVRIDAPGWGERCAECGNHGNDLESEEEDA